MARPAAESSASARGTAVGLTSILNRGQFLNLLFAKAIIALPENKTKTTRSTLEQIVESVSINTSLTVADGPDRNGCVMPIIPRHYFSSSKIRLVPWRITLRIPQDTTSSNISWQPA